MLQARASRATSERDRVTPEQLGRELREALRQTRLHCVSIHDPEGDALWMSEGMFGPDEHNAALEAMGTLGLEPSLQWFGLSLGDGRSAAVFPVRSPYAELLGVAMIIADAKSVDGGQGARLLNAEVRTVLQRLAVVLKPLSSDIDAARATAAPTATPAPATALAAPTATPATALAAPTPVPAPALTGRKPAAAQPAVASSSAIAPKPAVAAVNPAATRAHVTTPDAMAVLEFDAVLDIVEPDTLEPDAIEPDTAENAAVEEHTVLLSREALDALRRQGTGAGRAAGAVRAAGTASAASGARPVSGTRGTMRTPAPAAEDQAAATLYVPQAAVRDVTLHVQQLLKLRSGGRTRRYEVLLRSRSEPDAEHMNEVAAEILASQGLSSTMDRYITGELLTWLAHNRDAWDSEPASFSINIASSTMRDPQFLPYIAHSVAEADIPPDILGFELPESAIIADRAAADAFVKQCEQIGCFVVLDDFSLHSTSLPLLASSAVKLAKIDASLSAGAMKDKLSQAIVVAISQAAKVLGVNCVAKRVDTPVARQWLAAIGIDFAQGFLLEKPRPLESLAEPAKPREPLHRFPGSSRAQPVSRVRRDA